MIQLLQFSMIDDDLALRLLRIPAVVRYMHIVMIGLIVIATVVTHSVSFYYKFLFLAITAAYTVFLLCNAELIKLIFNLNKHRDMIDADVPRSWSSLHEVKEEVGLLKERREREERERAREEQESSSNDRHNSNNSRDVNESFMRVNKHREYREAEGKEYGVVETPTYSKLSPASTFRRSNDKSMHLIDRESMVRDSSYQQREDNDRLYQTTLREKLQKSASFVQSRYPIILTTLQPIVSRYASQDRDNTKKLKEIIREYLNVQLMEDECTRWKIEVVNNFGSMHNYHGNSPIRIKATVHYVLLKIWMVMVGMTSFEQAKFKFKDERSKMEFQRKSQTIIQERMRLAEHMGVDMSSLYRKREEEMTNFIKIYNKYISIIQHFLEYDVKNIRKNRFTEDEVSSSDVSQDGKNKIYILSLFVRHLNSYLDQSKKVKLSDYMNFLQPKYTDYALEIYPSAIYDAYRPHFNVFELRNGKRQSPLYCEYGDQNYLSVIFNVVYWLTKQKQLQNNEYVCNLSRIVQ